MSGNCLFCGGPANRKHHVTGRNRAGRYLDPGFIGAMCHSDHMLVHDDWPTLGVSDETIDDNYLASCPARLTRAAAFVGRLAEADPGPHGVFLANLACWLATQADQHAQSVELLDRYVPGWREAVRDN